MKIPTNPLPNKRNPRQIANVEERKRRKAQKRLEGLDYTPLTARTLSGILRDLANAPKGKREARLRAFSELANEKGKQ
jgi:hypothetical protein